MKKLLLIRHAKAEKDTSVKDFDRPLKYTGIQDASFMADRLKEHKLVPKIIVSSPALRTKTTAEIFTDHFKLSEPKLDKTIYEASTKALLSVINKFPNEYVIIGLFPFLTGSSRVYWLAYLFLS
jgi:phosphohistidine phosphatase